jgi:hypothetical protein
VSRPDRPTPTPYALSPYGLALLICAAIILMENLT